MYHFMKIFCLQTPGCLGVVQNIHSTALLQIDGKNVAMVMQHLENVLFQLAVPDNMPQEAAAELSHQSPIVELQFYPTELEP